METYTAGQGNREIELYSTGLCLSFVDTENSRMKLHSDGRVGEVSGVQFGSSRFD